MSVDLKHPPIECACPVPYQMDSYQQDQWAVYLNDLIDRVLAGKVRHISLSVHPVLVALASSQRENEA